jgi:4-hydroxy-2-oxoheptanedioate aldolase
MIGTWITINNLQMIKFIASKLDFVIIDMEHGHFSWSDVANIMSLKSDKLGNIFIRLPEYNKVDILHCLEAGCTNLLVSHVENVETAQDIVNACHYKTKNYPFGERGLSPFTETHEYGNQTITDIGLTNLNRNINIGILVEGSGLEQLKEIVQVKNIGIIYLGIYDIAQHLGLSGDISNPKMLDVLKQASEIINYESIQAGTFAMDIDAAHKLGKLRYDFIAINNDMHILTSYYDNIQIYYNM